MNSLAERAQARHIRRPDGRRLGYSEFGDLRGLPVFYLHGMPGSRLEGLNLHLGACCNGIRLICMDRPGIGQSDYHPDYRLQDFPQDLARLADHLGLDQFALLGWSSGGPPALACAIALPDRLRALLVLASYTNFGEDPAARRLLWDWGQRSPTLALASHTLFRSTLRLMHWSLRYLPDAYLAYVRHVVSVRDRQLLAEPDIRRNFMHTQRETFRQGIDGVLWDLYLEYVDWGFRLEQVEFPVQLIQGRDDPLVPWPIAERMAERLPCAQVSFLESAGHLFPLDPSWQFPLWSCLRQRWGLPNKDAGAHATETSATETSAARTPA